MNHRGFLFFVLLLLSACSTRTAYHSFQPLPYEGWQRSDTICFEVEITDSLTTYTLTVEVRNRNDYPFCELPLSVSYDAPGADPLPANLIETTLNNGQGNWTGQGYGNLYQTSIPAGSILVGKPGTYRIKIVHRSTEDCLKGLSDIGIKLQK